MGLKVWGIVGWKNTGKTGLTVRLVQEFTQRGLRVSTIKHAHHGANMDQPGTDSFRHRTAGAQEVLLSTPSRIAVLQELRDAPEPSLEDLIARLQPADLILIEGYKRHPHPKIETHRAETGKPLIAREDDWVRAVASDTSLELSCPVFDLDDTVKIADFIAREVGL